MKIPQHQARQILTLTPLNSARLDLRSRVFRPWVRGIKLRLFAFFSVAASHDSFATGLRSGRPILVLPLLREYKTPGLPIHRFLENEFVDDTCTGTARDFIRLLTVELH